MRAIVATVLVLTLIPEVAMAARWERNSITVWSFVRPDWQPIVEVTIAAFNETFPATGPHLDFRAMGEQSCDAVKARKGAIVICMDATRTESAYQVRDGVISTAKLFLSPEGYVEPSDVGNWVCHEMMHILTDVPDRYSMPHEHTSCVQGVLDRPGSWDIAYAHRIYAAPDGDRRRKHDPTHHSHRP